jgi:hypothetical protein
MNIQMPWGSAFGEIILKLIASYIIVNYYVID